MDFSNYSFRAHQFGKIVSASGKFTDGNKTYLNELFSGAVNNVRKEVTSKYFEKGLFEEESGISLLNQTIYKGKLLVKNTERKNNGFVQGECDVIKDDIVYDIKNAWDIFTFEKSSLTHEYKWQLKVYMWLWNLKKARLFYCLNNTPDHIFESEARKMLWNNFVSEDSPEYIEAYNNLKEKHTHDSKPLEERFKVWDIELEDSDIEYMEKAVLLAREYLCSLNNERKERLAKNRELMGIIQTPIQIHDTNVVLHDEVAVPTYAPDVSKKDKIQKAYLDLVVNGHNLKWKQFIQLDCDSDGWFYINPGGKKLSNQIVFQCRKDLDKGIDDCYRPKTLRDI